jgi:hypothetical protein
VPEGKDDVMMDRAGGATTKEIAADLVCAGLEESETVAVKVTVPLAVGVPETRPVAGARLKPLGRLPPVIDQVYGSVPPVALSVPL